MPKLPARSLGPLTLPWQSVDELLVILACGLVGAVLGATALSHYRAHRAGA